MRVSTLRWIDRWVGVPICIALTWHRRLFCRHERAGQVRRILFVKLAEQGSTVLAAGAFAEAVGRVGRENVFFLAFEENRFILDAMDVLPRENVLTIDARGLLSTALSGLVLLRRLRGLRVDAAVGLEFFARSSAILTYLSGAACRVGLHSHSGEGPYCGDLHTHRLVYNPYLHTADLFRVMVQAIDHSPDRFPAFDLQWLARASAGDRPGDAGDRPARRFSPPAADVEAVRGLLHERFGGALPRLVLLNANCSDLLPLRRWATERYVELAVRLLEARADAAIVLTGAPNEAAEAEALAASIRAAFPGEGPPRCVSMAGRTTLPQLLALYTLSEVLVTNDSGPAHFATLTGIDVVTLFGPETPALFAARTPRNHVLWAGTACSPCVNAFNNRLSACHDNICMQRLAVDDVASATLAALDAR
jgi:ADP-heptose:LPS heptosyltransferase